MKMLSLSRHSLLALPLLLVGACAPIVDEAPMIGEPAVNVEVQPLLMGSLGNVIDFEGVPEVTGYSDADYMFVDVRTRGVGWAAMTGLNIFGTLGEGQFAVGKRVTVDRDDMWSNDPGMTMIGCSGQLDGDWDYDCQPDDIVLEIAEGRTEGEFLLNLRASFDDDCDGDDDDDARPVDATFYVSAGQLGY